MMKDIQKVGIAFDYLEGSMTYQFTFDSSTESLFVKPKEMRYARKKQVSNYYDDHLLELIDFCKKNHLNTFITENNSWFEGFEYQINCWIENEEDFLEDEFFRSFIFDNFGIKY